MTRKPRHRNLADAARGYNEPPTAPSDRMWERIDAARREARPDTPKTHWWRQRRVLWPVAVAASLTLGLIIGRGLPDGGFAPSPVDVVHDGSDPIDPTQSPTGGTLGSSLGATASYTMAARPLLARSESLLLQVQTDTTLDPRTYGQRARDLLALTRLLLDSPAAEAAGLAPLLPDLELALARIVQLARSAPVSHDSDQDLQTLQEGLAHQSVLPRLRNQLAAGTQPVGL